MSSPPTYEILALRYAHLERTSVHNFVGGDDHATPMPLDYFVWLVRGNGRTLLIDTGFDEAAARSRGRQLTRPVSDGLKAAGVAAESIEDIIITHMHYDHAGNLALFPRARFHLQDAEMAYCTGRAMTHAHLRAPFAGRDVADMVTTLFQGRVVFHAGDEELAPGLSLHHVGGHTPGLQAVRVNTARGPVVLASDAAHFWANITRGVPFPIVTDLPQYLESHRRLLKLAPSLDHIIPGHDPAVLTRFPAAAGIADSARLDLPPREH